MRYARRTSEFHYHKPLDNNTNYSKFCQIIVDLEALEKLIGQCLESIARTQHLELDTTSVRCWEGWTEADINVSFFNGPIKHKTRISLYEWIDWEPGLEDKRGGLMRWLDTTGAYFSGDDRNSFRGKDWWEKTRKFPNEMEKPDRRDVKVDFMKYVMNRLWDEIKYDLK